MHHSLKDETYYRVYYKNNGLTYYTDPYYDKEEALEVYCQHIERYEKVALVKIEEKKKIILGSLED